MRRVLAGVAALGLSVAGTGAEAGWVLWRYARDPVRPWLSWELIETVETAEACEAELAVWLEYDDALAVYFCLPDSVDPRQPWARRGVPGTRPPTYRLPTSA